MDVRQKNLGESIHEKRTFVAEMVFSKILIKSLNLAENPYKVPKFGGKTNYIQKNIYYLQKLHFFHVCPPGALTDKIFHQVSAKKLTKNGGTPLTVRCKLRKFFPRIRSFCPKTLFFNGFFFLS